MKVLQLKFKEEKFAQQRENERLDRERQNKILQDRKNKHVHVSGIRRRVFRSEKTKVQKTEVKEITLSEDQIDIQKYLGLQVTQDEERKQR